MGGGKAERAGRAAERRQALEHRSRALDDQLDHVVEPDRDRAERGADQPGFARWRSRRAPARRRARPRPRRCCRPCPAPSQRLLEAGRVPAGAHRAQQLSRSALFTWHRRRRIIGVRSACPRSPATPTRPGHHCGSTALRNLLGFHGVEISEEMAFGLGAGACFYYVALEDASPSRWFNGRTARLEENFGELTGAALELRTFEEGDDGAWEAARARGRRRPARCCCSPTSTTSTTTATRPTSPATPWSSPATTTRSPTSPTPASRSCRRRAAARTSTGRATAATPPTRSPATCSPPPAGSTASSCARRSRRRSSARPRRWSSPSSASSPASARSTASPRRPAAGPRSPRTGSGAPASATR